MMLATVTSVVVQRPEGWQSGDPETTYLVDVSYLGGVCRLVHSGVVAPRVGELVRFRPPMILGLAADPGSVVGVGSSDYEC